MNVMLLSVSVWAGEATSIDAGDARPVPLDFGADRAAGRGLSPAGRSSSAPRGPCARGALNMDVPISLGLIVWRSAMSVVETARGAEHAYFD